MEKENRYKARPQYLPRQQNPYIPTTIQFSAFKNKLLNMFKKHTQYLSIIKRKLLNRNNHIAMRMMEVLDGW